MTEHGGGRDPVTSGADATWSWPGSADMARLPEPPLPAGFPLQLAGRALVYLRPEKLRAVLPYVDSRRSGMVLAGAGVGKTLRVLQGVEVRFPVLVDPEGYRHHTATVDAPFWLPGADSLFAATLDEILDNQLRAGAAAALTPTGYIPAAGTDELKAAAQQFAQLGREDAIFLAPLDISLLGASYFAQTAAILAELGRPVAVVLGCQGNPLDQRKDIIPNLRALAHRVPLMPIRTDFNGLDLLCQGAVCAAIGTGGSVRHAVDPAEKDESFKPGAAPSVLWPELLTFYKGSTIAEFFGTREQLAPACGCGVCHGRRITRFLRREHQDEAIAHGIAVWSPLADRLLSAATVRDRAENWKDLCGEAVARHQSELEKLQRIDGLKLQPSLQRWAALPAWPAVAPALVP